MTSPHARQGATADPDRSRLPLESVLQSDEPKHRPVRPADHETENDALVSLTLALAGSPEGILQTVAEKVVEVFRCGSAGFSLLSDDARTLKWVAVAGAWKRHLGCGAPRAFSPGGDVLDRGTPQLIRHPERRYPHLLGLHPPAEEMLLVPLLLPGKVTGTLWAAIHVDGKGTRGFDAEHVRLLDRLGRFAVAAYSAVERVREEASHRTALQVMKVAQAARTAAEHLTSQLRESEARLAAELEASRALQEVSTRLLRHEDFDVLYGEVLEAAAGLMGSDMASMQRVDESPGGLRLLAFRGFEPEFGETFALLREDARTSCSLAWQTGHRVVVTDTETWDFLAGTPAAEDHERAGIRAVQSTPLTSRNGSVLGIISTHWRQPHTPSSRDLRLLDVLARQAADLVERRVAEGRERELRAEAEDANESKVAFLATMSHEMRTPLNAITGYSELLGGEIRGPLNEAQHNYVAGIEMGARHLLQIIQEILLFSRIEAGREVVRPEAVDLAGLARAACRLVEPLAAKKGLGLRCTVPERLEARVDPGKVRQMLLNLLGNAIKFTDTGEVRLAMTTRRHHVRLEVSDTGVGIPAAHQGRLFEPFARGPEVAGREKEGAGLGLAVTARLARLMGGDISFASTPGEGSAFTVTLPLGRARRTPARPASAPEAGGAGTAPEARRPGTTRRERNRAEDEA